MTTEFAPVYLTRYNVPRQLVLLSEQIDASIQRQVRTDVTDDISAILGVEISALTYYIPEDGDDIAPALQRAYLSGVRAISLPAGDFTIRKRMGVSNYALAVSDRDRFSLRGQGRGITTITVASGANISLINCTRVSNVLLEGFTLDGDYLTQTVRGLHGLRFDDVDGLSIKNVALLNSSGYGIGFQGNNSYVNILLDDIVIKNAWIDGIDYKNRDTLDGDFGNGGIRISNVYIENIGRIGDKPYAGIDVRGTAVIVNVWVWLTEPGLQIIGVRLRPTDLILNGIGGRYSTVANVHARSTLGPTPGNGSVGVSIVDDYVAVANVTAEGWPGYVISMSGPATGSNVVNVTANNCRVGAQLSGVNQKLTNCTFNNILEEAVRCNGSVGAQLTGITVNVAERGVLHLNGATGTLLAQVDVKNTSFSPYSMANGTFQAWMCPSIPIDTDIYTHNGIALRLTQNTLPVNRFMQLTSAVDTGEFVLFQSKSADDTGNASVWLCGQGSGGGVRLGLSVGRLGFFGVTGTTRQTLPAAASDPTTTQDLTNALRAVLIAHGLCL